MTAFDAFMRGEIIEALHEPFASTMGDLFVGVMIMTVIAALYITSDSVALPAVTMMLAGGLVIEFAPPQVGRIGLLIIFLGVTLAGSWLWIQRQSARR